MLFCFREQFLWSNLFCGILYQQGNQICSTSFFYFFLGFLNLVLGKDNIGISFEVEIDLVFHNSICINLKYQFAKFIRIGSQRNKFSYFVLMGNYRNFSNLVRPPINAD